MTTQSPASRETSVEGAHTAYAEEALAIRPRNVSFDWSSVPFHYVPTDAYATHFWNVMHLVLPEGERAMADVLGRALDQIEDPRLKEELIGFIGQEETHASSHESFRHYLEAHGVDIPRVTGVMAQIMDKIFGEHDLTGRAADAWFKERLGLYAAAEHFTAVVGEWLIDNAEFDRVGVDPTMLDLLRWHGAEEMEHRNVAFDVYQYVDGGYARRVRTAIVASAGLLTLWLWASRFLYVNDPRIERPRRPMPLAFIRSARRGLIPGIGFVLREIPPYVRRDFHPSKMGPIDKAVRYLANSPAARDAA
ncbi:metal-dependent hydrolase [Knoellia sinensis KCTC 19936]|uniref:Metal-dependent hydrolase n=1 Tax=Knoellia sinensis KCTC 19936 TaxID=1385520 RepID=A0A0A0J7U6_9MICO|nr:metal-dependent hydrolase [Knoellia sinensis]KGN32112.1 metal-dependent hydrolase [Knoellia sinensis KCTC 19936]